MRLYTATITSKPNYMRQTYHVAATSAEAAIRKAWKKADRDETFQSETELVFQKLELIDEDF